MVIYVYFFFVQKKYLVFFLNPHLADEFSNTNVVGIELVATDKNTSSTSVQSTGHKLVQNNTLTSIEIIYKFGLVVFFFIFPAFLFSYQ